MGCLLQPPSGGCVLKHANTSSNSTDSSQPPSGGCVLKRGGRQTGLLNFDPAAFRRLCVETASYWPNGSTPPPAAFRRLCVETTQSCSVKIDESPAAFRRLCVETDAGIQGFGTKGPAAFRRLCVETSLIAPAAACCSGQPPSGGCVLKPPLSESRAVLRPSRLQAAVC